MVRTSAVRAGRLSEKTSRPRSDGAWVHDKAPMANVVNTSAADRLVVSNLHYEILPKDLISIFGQIGTLVREPVIKFDRSGRSTGVAFVQFETAAEATRALRQFNNASAKGQRMSIEYDKKPLPKAAVSATSLVNRIEKPPLLERLNPTAKKVASLVNDASTNGAGAIRARVAKKKPTVKPAKPARQKKEPKTAADLDKELDAFMGDGGSAPAKLADGDVEMA